jgi:hypothetical protein
MRLHSQEWLCHKKPRNGRRSKWWVQRRKEEKSDRPLASFLLGWVMVYGCTAKNDCATRD